MHIQYCTSQNERKSEHIIGWSMFALISKQHQYDDEH